MSLAVALILCVGMAAEDHAERPASNRRESALSRLSRRLSFKTDSEYEPLLPETLEPSLYKTISVSVFNLAMKLL